MAKTECFKNYKYINIVLIIELFFVISAGRTFGGIRRLKLVIPAIMYKLGVVTTMLGFLTLLAIKGVLIGLIVLVLQLSAGLSKLHLEKKDHGWDYESNSWQNAKPPQNIHVHVHGAGHSGHIPSYYSSGGHHHESSGGSGSFWDRDITITPNTYSASANNKLLNNLNTQNGLDADLLLKLREYKELKALRDLRDSLYRQVV